MSVKLKLSYRTLISRSLIWFKKISKYQLASKGNKKCSYSGTKKSLWVFRQTWSAQRLFGGKYNLLWHIMVSNCSMCPYVSIRKTGKTIRFYSPGRKSNSVGTAALFNAGIFFTLPCSVLFCSGLRKHQSSKWRLQIRVWSFVCHL